MTEDRNLLSDWLKYIFTYYPTTNWFSPTINFGRNIEDAPVEQHVVDKVGSYGFQLNRILDGLSTVIEHSTLTDMPPEERKKVDALLKMAQEADDAAKEYEGKLTETGVGKLIAGLHSLKTSNPQLYQTLREQILREIADTIQVSGNSHDANAFPGEDVDAWPLQIHRSL